jgi:hypothetical protein
LADTLLAAENLIVFFIASAEKHFFKGVIRLAADGINNCWMAAIGYERWPNIVLTGKIACTS